MFLLSSVPIGPFRIALLFAVILMVQKAISKRKVGKYELDYIIRLGTMLGSFTLLLTFTLIQLGMFDIFSILTLFFGMLCLLSMDVSSIRNIYQQLNLKRRSFVIHFLRFLESDSKKEIINKYIDNLSPKKINFVIVMAFLLALTVFISRYLFIENDLYTLSSLWIKNMEIVKGFNSNIWFQNNGYLIGELALINLYAMTTGISEEMAIHTFGLIENFCLGFILYWCLVKVTRSKFIAPIFGVICFAFFYKYLPININLLLEHSSLYLALCFALPAMIYTLNPKLLLQEKTKYFLTMLAIYCAIGFINFFVLLIVLPIFLISTLMVINKSNISNILSSIWAFFLCVVVVLSINAIGCFVNHISFYAFLRSNMIQVNSYAYFPQLILPLEEMLFFYKGLGLVTLFMVVPLFIKDKRKWATTFVFLVFMNAFVLLQHVQFEWLDKDMYYINLAIFMVLLAGITVGLLVHYFKITVPKKTVFRAITLSLVFVGFTLGAYLSNGFFSYDNKKIDKLKTNLLEVYDSLSNDLLPYSYAVVNQDYGHNLSVNEHHFISYSDFLETYTKRDSVYHIYKDDKKFLQENTEYILPNSVFVIVTKSKSKIEAFNLETPELVANQLLKELEFLKGKGRKINVFRDDDYFTVYEIVNKKNSSKLNDLIFNL